MAKFIEATETRDDEKRQGLMDEILAYNREDLEKRRGRCSSGSGRRA